MSNILVEVARKEARRRLEARGVDTAVIDRLPSIEDGFVVWLSRSGMAMEAIDDMMQSRGGFVDRVELEHVVKQTTGHEPPEWVLDLLMTSMDASGDGLVTTTELWRWAAARGLDVPESLMTDREGAADEVNAEESPESEGVEGIGPEPTEMETAERAVSEPVATQPVQPAPVVTSAVPDLTSVFTVLGQNRRGVEIAAAVAANPQRFLITGSIVDGRATLLGEQRWRRGRTVGVKTDVGVIDLQVPEDVPVPSVNVAVEATLAGWNRGLARPVFRTC